MYYRSHRRSGASIRPFVGFLLIAAFGLLFVGCKGPDSALEEEIVFTEDDMARSVLLDRQARENAGTGSVAGDDLTLQPVESGSGSARPRFDLSMTETYKAVRSGPATEGAEDSYQVTNEFLNVRATPSVTAASIARLVRGDMLRVESFVDAAWAKVTTAAGDSGYVASRYIAKLIGEEQLAAEKKKVEGMYFVDFGFVNVRKAPDAQSEKLGELSGQAIVRPISMDQTWARVPFEGKEGYVAVQYLSPFSPNFLVRQSTFTLPVLHYDLSKQGSLEALSAHVDTLKNEGITIMTFGDFRDLLLRQQGQDVRLPPKSVLLAISGITAENVRALSDELTVKTKATLFLKTADVGLQGITEKTILTLLANEFDLQSAGHTGDDLRSLTNAQLELELQQSRAILEEITKKPVFAILYPQGGVNDRVAEKAAAAGYLLGVSAAPERTFTRELLLRMPSFDIAPGLPAEDLAKLAKGAQ